VAIITAVAVTRDVLQPRSKRIRKIEKRFGKRMEEVLSQLYWEESLTQAEVAKRLGVPAGTLAGWMIRFGVNRRAVEERALAEPAAKVVA
jgi:DNA-binding transcriptional regulator LsrR (DeoR family)